ncbi:nucleotidyltransferase domain-containing protein [Peribacillus butanolivorans]|uniref:nucleotidyltransferase domain-containing protein n=1 Tax=Peribacillus butanolivorans TaxID=421767 RepID=UPI003660ECF8
MKNNYGVDLSILPKELKLLLELMKAENEIESIQEEIYLDIDWGIFLQLAKHHRVFPIIYSKISKINNKLIPSHVVQILYQEYKMNTMKMLHLSGEMEKISKMFTENHISVLFLKGPVIAADIYGDISLRTSKDLDILISKKSFKKAEKLLLNYGYEREEDSNTFGGWKWKKHHDAFFHPEKKIQIEIHWRLHPAPTKEPSFNELWERKRLSELTGYPVYFLGKEDLLLYLVAHGSRHGWFRLRWLADIDQMVRKGMISNQNNEIFIKFQHYHLGKQNYLLIGQALILASLLLKTPISKDMHSYTTGKSSRKIAKLAISNIVEIGNSEIQTNKEDLNKVKKNHIYLKLQKSFSFNLYKFSTKSNIQKVSFIITLLIPSTKDFDTIRLPKPLHFLYFPLRPFLLIWRKIRRTV